MFSKIKSILKSSPSKKTSKENKNSNKSKEISAKDSQVDTTINDAIKSDGSVLRKSFIRITEVSTENNRINYKFETSEDMDKYFHRKDMFVEYMNLPDIDLSSVPKGILVIPLLTNLLPVSWICDSTIILDSLDETLFNALPNIRDGYSRMYPTLSFKGDIEVNELERNSYVPENEYMSLFTYGVDSLTTVLRHIDQNPILITLWGADIHLNIVEGWEKLTESIDEFSEEYDLEHLYVKSDFRQFMDTQKNLNDFLLKLDNSGNWWYAIQHGIALVGQASILAFVLKVKHILIASSHSYKENKLLNREIIPCGSSPTLDNEFKFASCSVVHDAYELSRADKLDVIMEYSKKHDAKFNLHVCWSSRTGVNCSVCEKCARTLMYIMAVKEDPENYGFTVNEENFQKIETDFKRVLYDKENVRGWSLHPVTLSFWKTNQEIFMEDYEYWKDTPIAWIFDVDFDDLIQDLLIID